MSTLERVPFLDLHASYSELKSETDSAVARVLDSGQYILGPEVDDFEAKFARFTDSTFCVGVGSGLDALFLGLKALGVGPGDDVLVPSNTYIATWLAVTRTGAMPIPVEPEFGSYVVGPEQFEAARTTKTKAAIPVHLYGVPAPMHEIVEWAERQGVLILDDAAQAHGSAYLGSPVGGLGHATAWSFYPGKNLGALGDGGAVTTDNPEIAGSVRLLRNYGSSVKYYNEVVGYNSRLDPLQAAILGVRLAHLREWNERRRTVADLYLAGLAGLPIDLPGIPQGCTSSWHLFVIRTRERDELQNRLSALGIQTLIHYPVPPHLSDAYRNLGWVKGDLPVAEEYADTVLSLPMGPQLTLSDAERVVEVVRRSVKE